MLAFLFPFFSLPFGQASVPGETDFAALNSLANSTTSSQQWCPAADGNQSATGPYTISYQNESNPAIEQQWKSSDSMWAHTPECVDTPGMGEGRLCAYTSTSFNNGRGLVLVTSPTTAASIARQLHDLLSNSTQSTASTTSLQTGTSAFRIEYRNDSNGPQNSIHAAWPIERHEQIILDHPIIITHANLDKIPLSQSETLLQASVSRLPAATRQIISAMSQRPPSDGTLPPISPILESHGGFVMRLGSDKHFALFPIVSFINHSCAPNAHQAMDASALSISIRAARPLHSNEEITVSYLWARPSIHFSQYSSRRTLIDKTMGFSCSCERCTHGSALDTLLDNAAAIEDALEVALTAERTVQPAVAREVVEVYRAVKLDVFLDRAYGHLARAYASVGDAKMARRAAVMEAAVKKWNAGYVFRNNKGVQF